MLLSFERRTQSNLPDEGKHATDLKALTEQVQTFSKIAAALKSIINANTSQVERQLNKIEVNHGSMSPN